MHGFEFGAQLKKLEEPSVMFFGSQGLFEARKPVKRHELQTFYPFPLSMSVYSHIPFIKPEEGIIIEAYDKNRGCLGCCTKPPLVISVDEPSKGLKIQGQRVKNRSFTEDFWSTSSGDIGNSAFPSHRSMSSISTSNQTLDTHSSTSGPSNSAEYVNHGLLLWNQTRQQWVGNKGSQKHIQSHEPKLSWNATYESLLGTNKPFPQPIPLAEMVDFLVDVWEQEGLYD